jgi:hypothetical protein
LAGSQDMQTDNHNLDLRLYHVHLRDGAHAAHHDVHLDHGGGPAHTPPNKTFSNFLFSTSEIRSDAVVVPPEEIVQESRDVLVIVHLRGPGELFEGHT